MFHLRTIATTALTRVQTPDAGGAVYNSVNMRNRFYSTMLEDENKSDTREANADWTGLRRRPLGPQ